MRVESELREQVSLKLQLGGEREIEWTARRSPSVVRRRISVASVFLVLGKGKKQNKTKITCPAYNNGLDANP